MGINIISRVPFPCDLIDLTRDRILRCPNTSTSRRCNNLIRPSNFTYSRPAKQCRGHISTRQQENEPQFRPCRLPRKVVAVLRTSDSHWPSRSNPSTTLCRIRCHSAYAHMHSSTALRELSGFRKHDKTAIVGSIDLIKFLNHRKYPCEISLLFTLQNIHPPTISHGQRRIQTPNSLPPYLQSSSSRSSSIRQQREQRLGRQRRQSVRQRWRSRPIHP